MASPRPASRPGAFAPPDPALIARAARLLAEGGLVAFPTETVYGLGADADQERAVRAIFAAKGRPADHPLIVHVAGATALQAWAAAVPGSAQRLVTRLWPGPLTLILPRAARARDAVTGGQDSVGLRCPSHPWAQALLRAFCARRGDAAAGIAAPSANRYGHISPTSAAHVRADLGEKPSGAVDLVLDGGRCPLGIESTIVDFVDGNPRILRPGSITAAQIRAVLGGAAVRTAHDAEDAPRASGRVLRHYAPGKPLELVDPEALPARVAVLGARSLGVLAPAQALRALAAPPALALAAAPDAAGYAHELYEALHRLDASGAQRLLVARPPEGADWEAIHDRLRRAAAGSAGRLDDAD